MFSLKTKGLVASFRNFSPQAGSHSLPDIAPRQGKSALKYDGKREECFQSFISYYDIESCPDATIAIKDPLAKGSSFSALTFEAMDFNT
jgi:hypothetical protein